MRYATGVLRGSRRGHSDFPPEAVVSTYLPSCFMPSRPHPVLRRNPSRGVVTLGVSRFVGDTGTGAARWSAVPSRLRMGSNWRWRRGGHEQR